LGKGETNPESVVHSSGMAGWGKRHEEEREIIP
jgi:hypothetical protein